MQELLKQAKTRKNSMDYTDISILHTNDMHSYMENFPKKAQLIADIRARNEQKVFRPLSLTAAISFG